uniref:Uncharacterized protein n=1 Tax=Arundo donax TaxID=35708 RepID=A0A0A9BNY8_ARUDO
MATHPVMYVAASSLRSPMYASVRHPTTMNLLAVSENVNGDFVSFQFHSLGFIVPDAAS